MTQNDEMEASALYAFSKAPEKGVECFAHLTNTTARLEDDFIKGRRFRQSGNA